MENETQNIDSQDTSLNHEKKQGGTGPLVGSIIIIFIVIAGGIYLFNIVRERVTDQTVSENDSLNTENVTTDPEIIELNSEINSIELDSIDAELDAIEAEIEAELGM